MAMRRYCRFWIFITLVFFHLTTKVIASTGTLFISGYSVSGLISNSNKQSQPQDNKMVYDRHISRGDSLMELKQYQNAMLEFQ